MTLALTACGGGGGGGDTGGTVATSLTLTGTAATGAAIANAPVQAKCSTGTGSATTGANGSFTIQITGGSLPCVIEVTPASGGALHSVIDGSGAGNFNVNITPLTELIAARLAGGAPAGLFTTFDATAQAKVNPAALDAAIASIQTAFQSVVDLTGVNPIKDALVAASGATAGNAHDQKLDALQAALLAARTTLAQVVTALATSGTSTAPVQTILQPATASCAGFRSGKYRVINPYEVGHDAAHVAHLITVDAAALKVTDDLDATHTPISITPDATAACKFTLPGDFGTRTVLVSKSGLAVVLAPSSTGQMRTSIVVPEQSLPIGELAGSWNFLEYTRESTTAAFAPASGTVTIDAAGNLTGGSDCTGLDACAAFAPPLASFAADTTGGFSIDSGRAFAFKTASGRVSMYIIDQVTGAITVATRQAALILPAVGDVTNYWDFTVGSNGVASALFDSTTTVKSVDVAAGSYTRQRPNGSIDSSTINKPRDGMRHRPAVTSPINTGGTVTFSELLFMPLPDTGVTVYTSVAPTQNFFGVSVVKP